MVDEAMQRIGGRVPMAWATELKAIAETTGKSESEILREAVGQYLKKHDPNAIKGTLEDVQLRLSTVEQKVGRLLKLVVE
jgi:predicted DNA-binding protein